MVAVPTASGRAPVREMEGARASISRLRVSLKSIRTSTDMSWVHSSVKEKVGRAEEGARCCCTDR